MKDSVSVNFFGPELLPQAARKPALIKAVCLRAFKLKKSKPRAFAGSAELNVIFVDRKKMLALNKRFLGHDYDTDVIAFPYEDSPGPDAPFGDVYVSVHQAKVQAKELGHPLLEEILALAVHGTLHLLGYDDSTPRKKARMFHRQNLILGEIRPAAEIQK